MGSSPKRARVPSLRLPRISPGFALFALLFILALVERARFEDPLTPLIEAVFLGVLCWVTSRITHGTSGAPRRGRLFPLQLAACAFVFVAIAMSGAVFNKLIPASAGMPIWQPTSSAFNLFLTHRLPAELTRFGVTNGVRNFTFDLLPLGIVLLACGVRLRDMGMGRFRSGSLKTALVWLTIPIAAFVWVVATHQVPWSFVALLWLGNLLQNGFTEEVLFRGMILGRLRAFLGNDWALLSQALLFGAWHYGLNLSVFHGNVLLAASQMITGQALFGYAWGYLTLRTGNVFIGSAVHLFSDSIADIPSLANSFVSLF